MTNSEHIKANYSLTKSPNGEWIAEWKSLGLTVSGMDRAKVVSTVHAQWGHFNHLDAALAFAEVFPRF